MDLPDNGSTDEEIEKECRNSLPDANRLRDLCSEGVPEKWRGVVWQVWLGVYGKRANLDIVTTELPPEELHVIKCDAMRTRQKIEFFRDPAVRL
jgi:hypothetical protein